MANDAGLEVKGYPVKKKSSSKGPSSEECEIVKNFYLGIEISGQASGRKDHAIFHEIIDGKKTKETKQIQYMLMLLKEAYGHFRNQFPEVSIGLLKFCSLRPFYVKRLDQVPHNDGACKYHERFGSF